MESELILVALAGFLASMVDGALGMGFGPTSSSILLSTGVSPAAVSATVNLAKVVTGGAAAVSHWRFRNIDHRLVLRLALPGCVGALVGVTVLANVDGDQLRPILAAILLLVGIRILIRFSRPLPTAAVVDDADIDKIPTFDDRGTEIAAAAGGITNGMVGAWGPVVTPFLLHRGLPPRWAIGSVNTAEVAVAFVSAGTILASLGSDGIEVGVTVAMLLGGVVAAPLAAWVIRFIPARGLGLAVAALLLFTQFQALAKWSEMSNVRWVFYGAVPVLVAIAAWMPRIRARALADAELVEISSAA